MDDLLTEFLTETNESLDTVDRELVIFEENPNNKEIVNNIFRLVHTIKGTCGFLGLPRLEAVAHASENLLGKFRDGELEVTPAAVTLILESIDHIKGLLAYLESEGAEAKGDDTELLTRLELAADGHFEMARPTAAKTVTPPQDAANDPAPAEVEAVEPEKPVAPEPEAPRADEGAARSDEAGAGKSEGRASQQSIRVNVDVLENLMTMVSELVLTRNQLLQMVRNLDDSEFRKPLERLSAITGELQDGVMKTRMQPIGNAWQKLPRIVRDASHDLGKKIRLVMRGEDTELDRQVSELIRDPLTHMVRNSCDHGLETPQERVADGKPETGTINLRAFHEGGHIIIELSDDGKGLNTARIKKRAMERGLVSEAEAESLTDAQIHKFIFNPGFSTAEKVTSISGRGVGMDVVRSNIELIGGSIDLKSVQGQGSTFVIKIPLTLAIVSALIVKVKGERFAIPQLSVLELVRTGGGSANIEKINEAHVLRLRNRLLPLVDVRRLLWDDRERKLEEGTAAFVVVMQIGEQRFGMIVDEVFDTEEIVVKPVATVLRHINAYSGNTILGDGSVIMILDPNGIATAITQAQDELVATASHSHREEEERFDTDEATSLLVFRAGSKEPKAVPLSLVTRLEEIDVSAIESSLGGSVVQYRNRLMPVLYAGRTGGLLSEGEQPMLVFTDDDHAMGLAVDEIVDIVEASFDIELASAQPGILGSAIVDGKATEIIDVSYYLKKAYQDWFRRGAGSSNKDHARRLLLVDDNDFFRNMVTPMLKVAGYRVTGVPSVEDAWKLHAKGASFDVIVSDIEMPGTNGFDFARAVRSDSRWGSTPIIAVSANEAPDYVARGHEAGFVDYVAKSDGDRLIASLSSAVDSPGEAA